MSSSSSSVFHPYLYTAPRQLLTASGEENKTILIFSPRKSLNDKCICESTFPSSSSFSSLPPLKPFPVFEHHVFVGKTETIATSYRHEEGLQERLYNSNHSIVFLIGLPSVLCEREGLDCRFSFVSYIPKGNSSNKHLPVYSFPSAAQAKFFQYLFFTFDGKKFDQAPPVPFPTPFPSFFATYLYLFDIAKNTFYYVYRDQVLPKDKIEFVGDSKEYNDFGVIRTKGTQPLVYYNKPVLCVAIDNNNIRTNPGVFRMIKEMPEDDDVPFIDSAVPEYRTFRSSYFKPRFLAFSLAGICDYIRRYCGDHAAVFSNVPSTLAAGVLFDFTIPDPVAIARAGFDNLKSEEAFGFCQSVA